MIIKELLIDNHLVFASLLSYVVAQILKFIIDTIVHRRVDIKRLFGGGGMPSSHSASVAALATASLGECGPTSPITAIALVLAVVVTYDAMGVRREVGKHAKALNDLADRQAVESVVQKTDEKKFNTLVGHTPFEVLFGIVLGIVIAAYIPIVTL